MAVAVKKAMVDTVAMTVTFPHCNIGITEITSNSRTTINFSSAKVDILSLKYHSKISTSTNTLKKPLVVTLQVEKLHLTGITKEFINTLVQHCFYFWDQAKKSLINIKLLAA